MYIRFACLKIGIISTLEQSYPSQNLLIDRLLVLQKVPSWNIHCKHCYTRIRAIAVLLVRDLSSPSFLPTLTCNAWFRASALLSCQAGTFEHRQPDYLSPARRRL
jgi:hypothetical protein